MEIIFQLLLLVLSLWCGRKKKRSTKSTSSIGSSYNSVGGEIKCDCLWSFIRIVTGVDSSPLTKSNHI